MQKPESSEHQQQKHEIMNATTACNTCEVHLHAPSDFTTLVRIKVPLDLHKSKALANLKQLGNDGDDDSCNCAWLQKAKSASVCIRLSQLVAAWSSGICTAQEKLTIPTTLLSSSPSTACVAWPTSQTMVQAVCQKVRRSS